MQIDYYPGSVWEYPYPYHHDITYGCGEKDQNCDAKIEAKEEAKEQGNKETFSSYIYEGKKTKKELKVMPFDLNT